MACADITTHSLSINFVRGLLLNFLFRFIIIQSYMLNGMLHQLKRKDTNRSKQDWISNLHNSNSDVHAQAFGGTIHNSSLLGITILFDPFITPSSISLICLQPSIPTASMVSMYELCAVLSMCRTDIFISSTSSVIPSCPPAIGVVVPTVKKGSSCSSGKEKSRSGSKLSLLESCGVDALPLMPALQPHNRPGIGMPASMSARVQALIAAASSDPSADRIET